MSFSLPFKYINAEELAELIKAKPVSEVKDWAVVDVRDSDFAGGNIVTALNYPSDTFHAKVDELAEKLETGARVSSTSFRHTCRGPKAARIYAETRAHHYPNPSTPQEIYVLRDGFSGFQSRYRATGVVPAFNQIETHPSLIQPELYEYANKKGIVIIVITAYSPLGNNTTGKPRIVQNPDIIKIAEKLKKDPAQVLVAWGAYQGFSVIPKSVTASRIKSNFEDFELPKEDFEAINKIGKANYARANAPADYDLVWPINIFDTESEKQYKKAF
ncbi:hypothetical protein L198_03571 [Cryptococcus wingfieldii CBS 7118]|uniref:Rhodanese domain-containing protein n=1 Tax=Cryptococcus wingfieldii CBS 7118 TaxID=1295528 RepID=A0A1E3JBU8_9TREE|nr:hypothetical protein L198_03571 [Cryptococcus wingfieldii CBS 7118]ODN98327.1 hypothetical protein L198_03571 [Cryptococcus wingfieldii CBS 7118]